MQCKHITFLLISSGKKVGTYTDTIVHVKISVGQSAKHIDWDCNHMYDILQKT